MDVRVAANGRMILPRAVRDAMGLNGEVKVTLTVEGDVVRLEPIGHRVRRARELYRQAIKTPRTTEDFLRDRREEAIADDRGNRPLSEQGGSDEDDGNAGS